MKAEDFSALAGEYALGLLEGEELAQAETLRASDQAFSAAILMWEMRLIQMADAVPPVAAPARLWDRISAATQPVPPGARKQRGWRGVFIGAGLAAACAAGLLVFLGRPQTPASHQLASLTSAGGGAFVVSETAGTMIVAAKNVSLPAGKTAELWMILPGHAPLPAGLFLAGQSLSAPVPAGVSTVVLAVSLEPPGGSPTGGPTGPIIAEGKITNL